MSFRPSVPSLLFRQSITRRVSQATLTGQAFQRQQQKMLHAQQQHIEALFSGVFLQRSSRDQLSNNVKGLSDLGACQENSRIVLRSKQLSPSSWRCSVEFKVSCCCSCEIAAAVGSDLSECNRTVKLRSLGMIPNRKALDYFFSCFDNDEVCLLVAAAEECSALLSFELRTVAEPSAANRRVASAESNMSPAGGAQSLGLGSWFNVKVTSAFDSSQDFNLQSLSDLRKRRGEEKDKGPDDWADGGAAILADSIEPNIRSALRTASKSALQRLSSDGAINGLTSQLQEEALLLHGTTLRHSCADIYLSSSISSSLHLQQDEQLNPVGNMKIMSSHSDALSRRNVLSSHRRTFRMSQETSELPPEYAIEGHEAKGTMLHVSAACYQTENNLWDECPVYLPTDALTQLVPSFGGSLLLARRRMGSDKEILTSLHDLARVRLLLSVMTCEHRRSTSPTAIDDRFHGSVVSLDETYFHVQNLTRTVTKLKSSIEERPGSAGCSDEFDMRVEVPNAQDQYESRGAVQCIVFSKQNGQLSKRKHNLASVELPSTNGCVVRCIARALQLSVEGLLSTIGAYNADDRCRALRSATIAIASMCLVTINNPLERVLMIEPLARAVERRLGAGAVLMQTMEENGVSLLSVDISRSGLGNYGIAPLPLLLAIVPNVTPGGNNSKTGSLLVRGAGTALGCADAPWYLSARHLLFPSDVVKGNKDCTLEALPCPAVDEALLEEDDAAATRPSGDPFQKFADRVAFVPDIVVMMGMMRDALGLDSKVNPRVNVTQTVKYDTDKHARSIALGCVCPIEFQTCVTVQWPVGASIGQAQSTSSDDWCSQGVGEDGIALLASESLTVGPLRLLIRAFVSLFRQVMAATQSGSVQLPTIEVRNSNRTRAVAFLMYSWFRASPQTRLFAIVRHCVSPLGSDEEKFAFAATEVEARTIATAITATDVCMHRGLLFFDVFGHRVLFGGVHADTSIAALRALDDVVVVLNSPRDALHQRTTTKVQRYDSPSAMCINSPYRCYFGNIEACGYEVQLHVQASTTTNGHDICILLFPSSSKPNAGNPIVFKAPLPPISELRTFALRPDLGRDKRPIGVLVLLDKLCQDALAFALRSSRYPDDTNERIQSKIDQIIADALNSYPVLVRDGFPLCFSARFYSPTNLLGECLQGICSRYECDYVVPKANEFECQLYIPSISGVQPHGVEKIVLGVGRGSDKNAAWKDASRCALALNFNKASEQVSLLRDVSNALAEPISGIIIANAEHQAAASIVATQHETSTSLVPVAVDNVVVDAAMVTSLRFRFPQKGVCSVTAHKVGVTADEGAANPKEFEICRAQAKTDGDAYIKAASDLLLLLSSGRKAYFCHVVPPTSLSGIAPARHAAKPPSSPESRVIDFTVWDSTSNYHKSVLHAYCGAIGVAVQGRVRIEVDPVAYKSANRIVGQLPVTVLVETVDVGNRLEKRVLYPLTSRPFERNQVGTQLQLSADMAISLHHQFTMLLFSVMNYLANSLCSPRELTTLSALLRWIESRELSNHTFRVSRARRIEALFQATFGFQCMVRVETSSDAGVRSSWTATAYVALPCSPHALDESEGAVGTKSLEEAESRELSLTSGKSRKISLPVAAANGATSREATHKLHEVAADICLSVWTSLKQLKP